MYCGFKRKHLENPTVGELIKVLEKLDPNAYTVKCAGNHNNIYIHFDVDEPIIVIDYRPTAGSYGDHRAGGCASCKKYDKTLGCRCDGKNCLNAQIIENKQKKETKVEVKPVPEHKKNFFVTHSQAIKQIATALLYGVIGICIAMLAQLFVL